MSEEREWIIQSLRGRRYINETQPTQLLTRTEMIDALSRFERKFPHMEFRGHNWVNVEAFGGGKRHYEFRGRQA